MLAGWIHERASGTGGKLRTAAGASVLAAELAVLGCTPNPPAGVDHAPRYASPGLRNGHVMTYDARRDRVVLFGGADDERVLADTWEYDGGVWRRVAIGGPAARTFPAIAYHARRGTVLLFGGNRVLFGPDPRSDSTLLGDLWEWDGTRWRLVAAAGRSTPTPRAESVMTYDSARDRLVLYGGYTVGLDGRSRRFGDTWEWDGRAWREVTREGPAGRSGSAMVFNPVRRRSLLFGGSTGTATDEAWEWDGNRWRLLTRAPGRRFNPSMVYDAAGRRVLAFGGWNGMRRLAEMLELRDTVWRPVPSEGPSPRNHSAVAYDTRRGRMLLFGGHDGDRVFGDMWAFEGLTWRELVSTLPRPRVNNGH